jgi:hypothetical protein
MFGLDLLILISFGGADRFLNSFLTANGKPIESHFFITANLKL